MEDNTESNSSRTDADINCLLALWGEDGSPFLMLLCWKSAVPACVVSDAYIVTTANDADRLVMSGHTNLITCK